MAYGLVSLTAYLFYYFLVFVFFPMLNDNKWIETIKKH